MARYATDAELKSSLGIDDTVDDDEITRALTSAEDLIDETAHRSFDKIDTADSTVKTTRTYQPDYGVRLSTTTVRLGVGDLLWVDDVAKVDSVEKQTSSGGSWTTVDAGDYELHPLNAAADSEPFTRLLFTTAHSVHRLRVTGWFGWPEVPNPIVQATILQGSRLVKRAKEAPFGVAAVGGFEGTALRLMNKLDPDVELLVRPFVRNRVLV